MICKYFLPFCRLSFHFISGFLSCTKAFKFNKVPFVYFCFYFFCLRRQIQKNIATIYVSVSCLCSSRSFMASGLTFRSLIQLEFLFVYGVKKCSNLILLHVAVCFSQHHLLKRLLFSIAYSCRFCHRLIDHRFVGLFLESQFCSIDLCLFLCHYHAVLITVA